MSFNRFFLDDDGQPLNLAWNFRRRKDAGIDELLGLIRGIVADGVVSESEVICLAEWVIKHREISDYWPVNVVVRRLGRILGDGVISDREREDLRLLLNEIIGQKDAPRDADEPIITPATALPLCKPAPVVLFRLKCFVFTGKFIFGTRRDCQAEVLARGGIIDKDVSFGTSYLVIGSMGSRDWIHGSWGRKIEKAVEYRERCPLSIVSEQRWAEFLV